MNNFNNFFTFRYNDWSSLSIIPGPLKEGPPNPLNDAQLDDDLLDGDLLDSNLKQKNTHHTIPHTHTPHNSTHPINFYVPPMSRIDSSKNTTQFHSLNKF